MTDIRVTYSGLISLAIGLISVVTGIIFTLIVTRQLSPEEFGTWNLIGSLILYVVIAEPIISYWTTRQVARGIESGRTAVFSSGLFSIVGMIIYLLIVYLVSAQTNAEKDVMLLAVTLVPIIFINRTLVAINLGWRPQATSYGILVFEVCKIPFALLLVYFLDTGVSGAIIATAFGYISSTIVLGYYAKDRLKDAFNFGFLKGWIKLSWLPMYPGIGSFIFTLDVLIFSIITGSVVGLAYYSVALAIAALVGHSGMISQALYAKLLEGGKRDYLRENLIRFFYFGIPLTAISIVFAKSALFALNPIYVIAIPVVIIMSVRGFLYQVNGIFDQSLQGIDEVDINEKSTFKDYIKSRLFFVPSLRLIRFSSYTATLFIMLMILRAFQLEQIDLVIYWAYISLIIEIPFVIYLSILIKRQFVLQLPVYSLIKYSVTSVCAFGIIFLLMEKFLVYDNQIFVFLPNVIMYVLLGGISYLGITYVIDNRTKKLFDSIIIEVKHWKNGRGR